MNNLIIEENGWNVPVGLLDIPSDGVATYINTLNVLNECTTEGEFLSMIPWAVDQLTEAAKRGIIAAGIQCLKLQRYLVERLNLAQEGVSWLLPLLFEKFCSCCIAFDEAYAFLTAYDKMSIDEEVNQLSVMYCRLGMSRY